MSYEPKHDIEVDHVEDPVKAHRGLAAAREAETKYADLGADWLAQYSGPEIDITTEESDRVRWKIDRNILPL